MSDRRTPFDSIEGSLEYIVLLRQAIESARGAVAMEKARAQAEDAQRRIEALQLVAYKLERLASHTDSSRRLLNDLRTLRRLLLNEREEAAERPTDLAHP